MRVSSAVAEQISAADAPQSFSFNIPAQSLDAALIAFSTTTGFELVYDSKLIARSMSSEVRGSFSAEDAVALILSGSGLHARKIAARTITISRDTDGAQDQLRRRPERDRHVAYFAAVQDSLNDAFCAGGVAHVTGQRLMLRFRVSPTGDIAQLELVDLSDRGRPDPAVAQAVSRLTLKMPPPADLPQPVMVLIRPAAGAEDLRCASRH